MQVPHKIWARSVQPFWSLFDTKKQKDRQSIYIYRNVDMSVDNAQRGGKNCTPLHLYISQYTNLLVSILHLFSSQVYIRNCILVVHVKVNPCNYVNVQVNSCNHVYVQVNSCNYVYVQVNSCNHVYAQVNSCNYVYVQLNSCNHVYV